MKDLYKEYKNLIIGGLLIVLLIPIILNCILLIPLKVPILGDDNGWLAFWGSYLGAIMSSAIAFSILFVQRRDNRKENIANRQLQLSVLSYQQQCQWLDNFRKALLADIMVYKTDSLKEIINIIRTKDIGVVQQKIKDFFDCMTETDTEVSIIMKTIDSPNDNLISYNNKRIEIYDSYFAIVNDLQVLAIFYCLDIPKKDFEKDPSVIGVASDNLKSLFAGLKPEEKLNYNQVFSISNQLISSTPSLFNSFREETIQCINEEQKRIHKILTDNI